MSAVKRERPLLSMAVQRTYTGYTLYVSVPDWTSGDIREYQYEFATLAALRERMDALQAIWLDGDLISLGDNLEPC